MTFPHLRGRRVLVTGATGFIGGQLVARLVGDCGAEVRALVRSFGSAAAIARFPVTLVRGDIGNAADVDAAVAGAEMIFHCAYGKDGSDRVRRQTTVAGAEHVMAAALRHKVARVVYVSTAAVYGDLTMPELDETAPRKRTGDTYGDSKIEAEEVVLRYWEQHRVPVTVVQPTVVYGPFGFTFTINPLQQLQTGWLPLINGGTGRCNAVYVDDVVAGMLLAASREEAVGESFLLTGPAPVTWADFYGAYEKMLGVPRTVSMTPEEALAHYKASQRQRSLLTETLSLIRVPEVRDRIMSTREGALLALAVHLAAPGRVRALLKRTLKRSIDPGAPGTAAFLTPAAAGTRPPASMVHSLRPARIKLFASPTAVRIDKAVRLLGYEPRYDLAAGMALTRSWAQWANLLNG